MGVTTDGRFSAVTNYRDGPSEEGSLSRAELPTRYLTGHVKAREYAQAREADGNLFGDFSLLTADSDELWWVSNRSSAGSAAVTPGFHGLSNAELDTPWPKVRGGVAAFENIVRTDDGDSVDQYLGVLHDTSRAASRSLPDTGIPQWKEKLLSPRFVWMGVYGTRSSTVLRITHDGDIDYTERTFPWFRHPSSTRSYDYSAA